MHLAELIAYFETTTLPPYPIKYGKIAMAGPDFIAIHIARAEQGNFYALQRLRELHNYLEDKRKQALPDRPLS